MVPVILLPTRNSEEPEDIFATLNITAVPKRNLTLSILASPDAAGNITSFSPGDIDFWVRTDIAYRYALVNLNPFAVIGAGFPKTVFHPDFFFAQVPEIRNAASFRLTPFV